MKKILSIMLVVAMCLALVACADAPAAGETPTANNNEGNVVVEKTEGPASEITITLLSTKPEIVPQLEAMAEAYYKQTGVKLEVYPAEDQGAAILATKYAAADPYTIWLLDAADLITYASEYAVDLSDQKWVNETNNEILIDGKVYGFPFCVEATGLIYNADAIEAITGKAFNPADYATPDKFKALLDELVAGGITAPVGIMKEDWCVTNVLRELYLQRDDVNAFIDSLKAGTADVVNDYRFNSLLDTFDVLMQYNINAAAPMAAEREVLDQYLADGEIAFVHGGNFEWPELVNFDCTENVGIMAVPQNMEDGSNAKIHNSGGKFIFVDGSEYTSEEQQKAALDFLNWLVYDKLGNSYLVDECSVMAPFTNIDVSNLDPLTRSVKAYLDANAMTEAYPFFPGDLYTAVGAIGQKYLAGESDRATLAAELEAYWLAQ